MPDKASVAAVHVYVIVGSFDHTFTVCVDDARFVTGPGIVPSTVTLTHVFLSTQLSERALTHQLFTPSLAQRVVHVALRESPGRIEPSSTSRPLVWFVNRLVTIASSSVVVDACSTSPADVESRNTHDAK